MPVRLRRTNLGTRLTLLLALGAAAGSLNAGDKFKVRLDNQSSQAITVRFPDPPESERRREDAPKPLGSVRVPAGDCLTIPLELEDDSEAIAVKAWVALPDGTEQPLVIIQPSFYMVRFAASHPKAFKAGNVRFARFLDLETATCTWLITEACPAAGPKAGSGPARALAEASGVGMAVSLPAEAAPGSAPSSRRQAAVADVSARFTVAPALAAAVAASSSVPALAVSDQAMDEVDPLKQRELLEQAAQAAAPAPVTEWASYKEKRKTPRFFEHAPQVLTSFEWNGIKGMPWPRRGSERSGHRNRVTALLVRKITKTTFHDLHLFGFHSTDHLAQMLRDGDWDGPVQQAKAWLEQGGHWQALEARLQIYMSKGYLPPQKTVKLPSAARRSDYGVKRQAKPASIPAAGAAEAWAAVAPPASGQGL